MPRSAALPALIALLATARPAGAENFAHFQARADSALRGVQIRIACLDSSHAGLPALCVGAGARPNPALFDTLLPPRADGIGHVTSRSCSVGLEGIRALLDSLALVPEVARGADDSLGVVSVAVLDTAGGTQLFQAVLDPSSGLELVERAFGALSGNPGAAQVLAMMGCALSPAARDRWEDVTGSALVLFTGFSWDPARREVGCVLRVVNHSRTPLPAPLVVAIEPRSGAVRLVGADGFTCGLLRPGTPYVVLAVGPALAPGAMVERRLRFENPRQENLDVDRRVLTGTFER